MIWLASFPRSGNTFFRNVLYEVYGIESSTYHQEANYPLEADYDQFDVVKTHLLPSQLVPADPRIKKVYIVREGRDALVSIAHHRKDIVQPGTDYYLNLLEAILAMDGSFFGGWSENVRQWMEVADIVIRFEDLIEDPIRELEKLRTVMELPQPNLDKLPTFQDLKFGTPQYGAGRKILGSDEAENMAKKNFRRGKSGAWKDEMPPELEQLFWELHGHQMDALGYTRGPIGDAWARRRNQDGGQVEPFRILVEANKVTDPHMDGVRRYTEELLFGLTAFQRRQPDKWRIDVLVHGEIIPLQQFIHTISERREAERLSFGVKRPHKKDLEHYLLAAKMMIKSTLPEPVYRILSPVYRTLPFRDVLRWIRGETVQEKYRKAWRTAGEHHQLIHVPLPQNAYFVDRLHLPIVVTVHDLTHKLFPDFHERENVKLAEQGMAFVSEKARAIIAVSAATRNDLIAEYPVEEERVFVIHEAANGDQFEHRADERDWKEVRERYGIPDQPYFVTLSTLEPRKNLQGVIGAFLHLKKNPEYHDLRLVICGRKGWKLEELFPADQVGFDDVIFTGHVLDDDLSVLYSRALALCYVAHYEGFGLPPLEAMRCGTPVIYGDKSAMPEVVAGGGLGADPRDILSIADGMARLYREPGLRKELGQAALQRSWHFSWLKAAFQTLTVYENVIANAKGQPIGNDQ
ncbi:MAG: glycosyltransferase [Saprospiraceae bacterium]|nr:glycosyltransferase [Saprospiraceae bacterium]